MTRKLRHVVSLGEIADKFAGGTAATVTNWRTRYPNFPVPRRPGSRPLFNLDEIIEWYLWEGPGRRRDLKSEAHSWDDPAWRWTKTVQAFRAVADGADITSNLVALITVRHALIDRGVDTREWSALVESTDPASILPGLIGRVERADRNLYGLLTPAGAVPESAHPYLHDVLTDLEATRASSTSAELIDAVLTVRDEFLVTRHSSTTTGAPLVRCMVAAAQLEPGMSMLDPAVGEGALVLGAARSVRGRLTILGGDTNRAALRIARSRLYVNGFDEHLVKTEVDSLAAHEFDDVTADVVLLDPPVDKNQRFDTWLRFAVEHVKPGGRAVVAIPASSLVGVRAARRQPDLRVRRYLEEIRGTSAVTAAVVLPRNWRTDVVGPLVILVLEHTTREVADVFVVSALDSVGSDEFSSTRPSLRKSIEANNDINERVESALRSWREGSPKRLKRLGLRCRDVPLDDFFGALGRLVEDAEEAVSSKESFGSRGLKPRPEQHPRSIDHSERPPEPVESSPQSPPVAVLRIERPVEDNRVNWMLDDLEDTIRELRDVNLQAYLKALDIIRSLRRGR